MFDSFLIVMSRGARMCGDPMIIEAAMIIVQKWGM